MKKLLILSIVMAFLAFSCKTSKDNNIYVDHAKEKNQYKSSSKKYKSTKRVNKTQKK